VYEGWSRAYLGEVEGANIIKIHRRSGKLSYPIDPEDRGPWSVVGGSGSGSRRVR